MLRPLTPMAPGTHRYRATFAALGGRRGPLRAPATSTTARSGRPTPRAPGGSPSRRSARWPATSPAWRIRQVARVDGARRGPRRAGAERAARPAPADHRRGAVRDRRGLAGGARPRRRELLAEVAAAVPADVDRAVRAADAAWPAWAALPPGGAGAALEAYAALVDAEQPALAELVHRETGKPLGEAAGRGGPGGRGGPPLRRRGRAACGPSSCPAPTLATGSWVRPAPGRGGGRDHPLELPGRAGGLEAGAGAGRRLRGGGQARRRGPPGRLGALRPGRARRAAGRGW